MWESTQTIEIYITRGENSVLVGLADLHWSDGFLSNNEISAKQIYLPDFDDLEGMWVRAGLEIRQDLVGDDGEGMNPPGLDQTKNAH